MAVQVIRTADSQQSTLDTAQVNGAATEHASAGIAGNGQSTLAPAKETRRSSSDQLTVDCREALMLAVKSTKTAENGSQDACDALFIIFNEMNPLCKYEGSYETLSPDGKKAYFIIKLSLIKRGYGILGELADVMRADKEREAHEAEPGCADNSTTHDQQIEKKLGAKPDESKKA